MRSVELQSGVVLQSPGDKGATPWAFGTTTRPPGRMRSVFVPCTVHRLKLPLGTYGTAGLVPGIKVRLARLQVDSNPAYEYSSAS
jgi:hypothetical protein